MTRKQLEQLPKAELIEIILQQQAAILQQQAVVEQSQERMTELERATSHRKTPLTPPFSPPPSPASPIARSANRRRSAGPSPTTKAPAAFATMATVIETAAKRSEDALPHAHQPPDPRRSPPALPSAPYPQGE